MDVAYDSLRQSPWPKALPGTVATPASLRIRMQSSSEVSHPLPRIHSLTASVKAGSESLYLLDAAQF